LPSVQKFLEDSKLNTLDDFCQGIIKNIDSNPEDFQGLSRSFLLEFSLFQPHISEYYQHFLEN
jgi:hypothetical protein